MAHHFHLSRWFVRGYPIAITDDLEDFAFEAWERMRFGGVKVEPGWQYVFEVCWWRRPRRGRRAGE